MHGDVDASWVEASAATGGARSGPHRAGRSPRARGRQGQRAARRGFGHAPARRRIQLRPPSGPDLGRELQRMVSGRTIQGTAALEARPWAPWYVRLTWLLHILETSPMSVEDVVIGTSPTRSSLLGAWRGEGKGEYPTMDPSTTASGSLRTRGRRVPGSTCNGAGSPATGRPCTSSAGSCDRGTPRRGVELTLAHPLGLTEVSEGMLRGGCDAPGIDVRSGGPATGMALVGVERRYRIDGDEIDLRDRHGHRDDADGATSDRPARRAGAVSAASGPRIRGPRGAST